MLRKKQKLRLLTVLLVGSLFTHGATALNWIPSISDVTSTASHLLSYPGSVLMQLGGYTGINNLLSRIAPERWTNMTLQDRQSVVALVSGLVSAVLAFVWKYQASASDTAPGNPAPQAGPSLSSKLSNEQTAHIELLEKEITSTNEDLKKVIEMLRSPDTTEERGALAIDGLEKRINKLNETIESYTFMPEEVKNRLNTRLKQMRQALAVASYNIARSIFVLTGYYLPRLSSLSSEEKKEFNQGIRDSLEIIHDYIKNYGQIDNNLEKLRQQLLNIQASFARAGAQ